MVLFAAAVTGLAVLAVGTSLAAATHPALAPVVLGIALALTWFAIPSLAYRRLLSGGIAFIALVTIPAGCLTHGVVSGASSTSLQPVMTDAAQDSAVPGSLTARFAHRAPSDSVQFGRGMLVSFPQTTDAPAAVAYRYNGHIQWADAFPQTTASDTGTTDAASVTRFTDLTLTPLLWRVRVDGYVHGPDGAGWLYIWRWGGTQRLYVLDPSERLPSG